MDNILRIDGIRISKLIEMTQYAIIGLVMGILTGGFLNKFFPKYGKRKSLLRLLFEIILQLMLAVIAIYYTTKIIKSLPFLFHFDKNYVPSKKDENIRGLTIGMSLTFIISQHHLVNKIRRVAEKIYG